MDVFERILRDALADGEGVGLSARITHKGKDLYRGAVGYADKENWVPYDCDTLARIFSMTKLVTGVAALMLFEQGYFTLDDPLYKYLPAFQDLKVVSFAGDGSMLLQNAKNHVTLRHLFTMTAGFPYQISTATASDVSGVPRHYEASRAAAAEILEKTARTPNLTSSQMLEAIATIPLAFEPGAEWMYGVNSDILAGVIEAITGMSFGAFLQEELFTPLGMKDTCFRPGVEQLKRLAVLYDYGDPANVVPYDTGAYNIDHSAGSTNEHFVGALFSTLDDFTVFLQMLSNGGTYEGKRLLGANTVRLMATDHLTEQQLASYRRVANPGGSASWGLMCRVTKTLNQARPYLFPGSFGWGGWAGTQAAVDPANELTLTMMVQRVPANSYGVMSKLMQAAYGAI